MTGSSLPPPLELRGPASCWMTVPEKVVILTEPLPALPQSEQETQ